MPDVDYKPLDDEPQPEPQPEEPTYESVAEPEPEPEPVTYGASSTERQNLTTEWSATPTEAPKSKAPVIIGLVIAAVVAIAGFLIYAYVIKPERERARQEELAKAKEAERLRKEQEAARLREEEERKRREAEEAAANAKPKEGTIEALTDRTSRYYVVVSSAVDGDLVMDYAKKLSAKGVSSKIIPPFGKYKFFRLAIGDFDTFASAQSSADASKAEYGDAVWVIRY